MLSLKFGQAVSRMANPRCSRVIVPPRTNTTTINCLTMMQVRCLNLHEYQCAQIMKDCGVNVPFGIPATTVEEAVAAAKEIIGRNDDDDDDDDEDHPQEVVIKSQILAGGRGLGKFTNNGLQGGVHIIPMDEVADYAGKMLGGTLVTKQSGPAGKPVNTVYIAKKMQLVREFYFAIMMDRSSQGPLIIACGEGGTSIEDLAAKHPEKIIKVPVVLNEGISQAQIDQIVDGLGVTGDKKAAGAQIRALYALFIDKDCTMVEVNPLAEDINGNLVAADAKITFDNNASFRQEEIFAQRDYTQEDPREVEAGKYDLNYIGFDGSIGFMVNGAGLAMATMDAVSMAGGSPANFLDVGGAATTEQIKGAFEIITKDPNVKAILVNVFGGIMRCDTIAEGIIAASRSLHLEMPIVVRLEGTNVELGKQMMHDSGLALIPVDDLDAAASKVVALAAE
jgi:succinyl-CoA synthetase beta subunit